MGSRNEKFLISDLQRKATKRDESKMAVLYHVRLDPKRGKPRCPIDSSIVKNKVIPKIGAVIITNKKFFISLFEKKAKENPNPSMLSSSMICKKVNIVLFILEIF